MVEEKNRESTVVCCSSEFVKGGLRNLYHSVMLDENRFEKQIDVLGDCICVMVRDVFDEEVL